MSLTVLAPLWLEALAVRRGLHDPASRVVRTGMGPARARAAADRPYAGVVAVAGVCGGVDPALRPGDIVVATSLLTLDGGARELQGADLLADAVHNLGLRCRTGPILSVDRLARSATTAAGGHVGVVAVDMESAWLAAAGAGGRFAVLRVVADAGGRSVYHPRTLVDGARALAGLRRAAPALEAWAEAWDPALPAGPRTIGLTAASIEFNLPQEVM